MSGPEGGTAGAAEPAEVTAGAAPEPAEVTVDCRGQRCPLPVIALARQLPGVPVGTVLRVLADDPAAAVDIPAWCRMRGQEFVGASGTGASGTEDVPAYRVRRRS